MTYRAFPLALTVLIAVLMLSATAAWSEPQTEMQTEPQTDPAADEAMATLVTTEWLSEHLDDPDIVVLDCSVRMESDDSGRMRPVSGRDDYEAGHVPSAGFADLTGELSAASDSFNFVLPAPEAFCSVMGSLGVGDGSRVVLYDGLNSVWAARVWWMLRWVGFDRAALLDGGLEAWTSEGRPLSTEPSDREAKELTCAVRPELVAYRDEVLEAIENDSVYIIDVMPEPHFRGEMAMYARPGHIPNALNAPFTSFLDETGGFRPQEELGELFPGPSDARAITYCGAGVAASAGAFVMTRLGFTDVAVYMGSLQEWAADPSNPLVVERAGEREPEPEPEPEPEAEPEPESPSSQ